MMLRLTCDHAYPPSVKRHGDVGFDLYIPHTHSLMPGLPSLLPTGVWVQHIDEGYWLQLLTKSGSPKKGFITLAGVVDSAYRGEIGVWVLGIGSESVTLAPGSAVAQGVLRRAIYPDEVVQVNDQPLSPTESDPRGADGGLWRA